jgi:hypothetical protein
MRDASMEQTALGISTTHSISGDIQYSAKEKNILRELAKQVAELAAHPREEVKRSLWYKLNDLQPVRPLVFCDPENGWNEIITQDQILCEKPLFRVWEMGLRKEIYWATQMQDDRVIEPYFNVPYSYTDSGWGLTETYTSGGDGGSHVWDAPIKDYSEDLDKLHFPEITVDYEKTNRIVDVAKEILGDILEVRLRGLWWWTLGMTMDFIHLRGLENLMIDMLVYPDEVHRMMAFLRDSKLHMLDFLEKNNLLALNTGGAYVGSGGFGWTSQLPQPGFNPAQVRTMDMWGFTESQETIGISPEMFEEFIFPYQLPIMERFGLNCYGCCEPLDIRWHVVKKYPRLRRVSTSPWANREKMAEYLGNQYVMSLKPSPTPLAMSSIDEAAIRAEIRKDLFMTRNCQVELIMKDNHTLGNNPLNAVRWCRIAKEEAGAI